jgi:hypothetical protein
MHHTYQVGPFRREKTGDQPIRLRGRIMAQLLVGDVFTSKAVKEIVAEVIKNLK